MSYSNAFMDFKFQANHEQKQYTFELEVDFKEFFRGLFYALFVGPELRRHHSPDVSEPVNMRAPLY